MLSSTTRADGFVIVPAESEGYGPDTEVTVYLYEMMPPAADAQATCRKGARRRIPARRSS